MKHRKKEELSGHVVLVYNKSKLVDRHVFPTYGKAWAKFLELDENCPQYKVEYRDARSFKEDTYE
ncbi:hypothetical protein UFOVP787_88 [uncultured Caudovirales phage]|uniref:Uncharacterized protein n=1 Tax=uncultured Caudovirales phage TaxID=2100421 RepID=A0A6J5NZU1_9CAUD|nr:hypothetical protein UFOVP787_88 [uncultured Caudovirales phage]